MGLESRGAPTLEPPHPVPRTREADIIDTIVRAADVRSSSVVLGPGDDAAVLVGGEVITVDALVEGVHWNDRLTPEDVGYKSVAVNASDIGAMGGRPTWMVLALCLPPSADPAWVTAFATGLAAASRDFAVPLVGGDTTRSADATMVSITMGGRAERPVTRRGGRPGDVLWVTGSLGLAAAGYVLTEPPLAALQALRRPKPPVAFAAALAEAGLVHAMMDLSDGLGTDLPRLCTASGCGASIDPKTLPLHPDLKAVAEPLRLQVGGGDDYQLLFAAAARDTAGVERVARAHDVALTPIGHLTDDPSVRLGALAWPLPYFRHFDGDAS